MKFLILLIVISLLIGQKLAPYAPRLHETKAYIVRPTIKPNELKTSEIIKIIAETFEDEGKQVIYQAISVAKNESGWRHDAIGYNCHYEGKSAACKVEDRSNAWSVDCGLMQINVRGQTCPVELLQVRPNIERAYEMYKRRAWQPWVAARKLGYVN